MTKRRVVAAGLPAAGVTVFAAALAFAGQPAQAAPQVGQALPALQEMVHPASLFAPEATTTGNSGVLTGNQIIAAVGIPVSLTCNAVAVGGTATTDCPQAGDGTGTGAGGYGTGGGRGNAGYGSATPTPTGTVTIPAIIPTTGPSGTPTTPGTGSGTGDTGGGRGNGGYGGESPAPPSESPSESPSPTPTPSPSTGNACCGVSPVGPDDEGEGAGELPSTGMPLMAIAALGGLLAGGGVALRYAGRHRREV